MPVEPTDVEVIRAAIESRLLDLHTAIPGKVVLFDPTTQTVDVQPVIKRPVPTSDDEIEHELLPVIHNVPIAYQGGAGYVMRFPFSPGNHVWVMFSEAAMAQWRTTGQISEPADLRRHDLSYACAIFLPYATVAEAALAAATPLSPPTEARMDCPSPFVFAADTAGQLLAQFVALSDKVDAALEALRTAHNTSTYPTAMGPSGVASVQIASAFPTTASTKLKAQ